MKKKITALLVVIMAISLSLTACSTAENTEAPSTSTTGGNASGQPSSSTPDGENDSKTLIVYYSLTGTTEQLAKTIQEKMGGDIYLLEPETPYTTDHDAAIAEVDAERESGELRDLKGTLPDISGYDLILIGGPVWRGEPSNPVQKYLSQTDFTGKKVAGFWTANANTRDYATLFEEMVQGGEVSEGLSLVSADDFSSKTDEWLMALGLLESPESPQSPVTVRSFDSTGPRAWSATFQVISSNKGNILIDPGKYDEEVADYIESLGGADAILLTHGHWDKLRGLDDAVAANPNATVYVHELDYPYFGDPVRNCSIEQGFEGTTQVEANTFTESIYEIGGYSIEVIHLPGHTEGDSVFYFKDENIMIGGDAVMPTLMAGSSHPGGNEQERQASIKKFKGLTFPADMILYHGHGSDTISYEDLMKTNVDLQ